MIRPDGVREARVIRVIATEALRGAGVEGDPVRVVRQYWSFDGTLLAERDAGLMDSAREARHDAARGEEGE